MQRGILFMKKLLYRPYCLLLPFIEKVAAYMREKLRSSRQRRLKNRDFTILTNNCVAGVIYHDLKHRFDSPTVNLFMSDEDYFEFLNHLDEYILQRPQEVSLENVSYPVGILKRGNRQITLHFMHYESFLQACEKWQERGRRIHKDNLYVIFNYYGQAVTNDSEWVKRFLELPYPNKAMLTHYKNEKNPYPDIYHISLYERASHPGQIFEYPAPYSLHRYLEEFDYVAFLNRNH